MPDDGGSDILGTASWLERSPERSVPPNLLSRSPLLAATLFFSMGPVITRPDPTTMKLRLMSDGFPPNDAMIPGTSYDAQEPCDAGQTWQRTRPTQLNKYGHSTTRPTPPGEDAASAKRAAALLGNRQGSIRRVAGSNNVNLYWTVTVTAVSRTSHRLSRRGHPTRANNWPTTVQHSGCGHAYRRIHH